MRIIWWVVFGFLLTILMVMYARAADCGGPPNYCAGQDYGTYPVTSVPKWGQAGSVVSDPQFGERILRATDNKTLGGIFSNRNIVTGLGGSGDVPRLWNSDSTLLMGTDSGGRCFPIQIDPVNFTSHGVLYNNLFQSGCGVFHTTDPNIFFSFGQNTATTVQRWNYTNRTVVPKPTALYNFKPCLGQQPTFRTIGGVNENNNVFTLGFSFTGGQDTTTVIASYDSAQKVCFTYNTQTGIVKKYPGGVIGLINTLDRFNVHNVKIKDSVAYITAVGGPVYAYPIGSTTVYPMIPQGSGHWSAGCKSWLNAPGNLYSYWNSRVFNLPDQITSVWSIPKETCGGTNQIPCAKQFGDHSAWTGGCEDNNIACASTYNADNVINGPFQFEIVCFTTDGTNKHWRFAHNYGNLLSVGDNFSAAYGIGQPNRTATLYAFTSKTNGQFGCTTGKPTCALGKQRSDILIVELK